MKCLCSKSNSSSSSNAKSNTIADHAHENLDKGCIRGRFKCQCSTCKKTRKGTGCHSTCCKLAGVGIIVAGTAGLLSLLWLSNQKNKVV